MASRSSSAGNKQEGKRVERGERGSRGSWHFLIDQLKLIKYSINALKKKAHKNVCKQSINQQFDRRANLGVT